MIGKRSSRPIDDDAARALERISALTAAARLNWFGLLGLLVFVLITLLGVKDIDFFGLGRETKLPLVGVSVPTDLFFWAAPPLTAAFYAYFHFYLLKLWDALGKAPAQIDGRPISEFVAPWLLTDAALRIREDGASYRRALGRAMQLTVGALTWVFGWIVMFFFWWRGQVAHDLLLSTLAVACFLFTLWVGLSSWVMLQRRLRRRVFSGPSRWVWRGWRRRGAVRVTILLAAVTVLRTWTGHPEMRVIPREWLPHAFCLRVGAVGGSCGTIRTNALMARADLSGENLTTPPADWLPHEKAEVEFRSAWCNRRNLDWSLCVKAPDAVETAERLDWCAKLTEKLERQPCLDWFAAAEVKFQNEWRGRRKAYILALEKRPLAGRDLRAADLFNAFLPGFEFDQANLNGAFLHFAEMERVSLYNAKMEGANLQQAQADEADLRYTFLSGADLSFASLRNASFLEADLTGSNFSGSIAENVDFRLSYLWDAELSYATLDGSDFWGVRMEDARFYAASANEVYFFGARMDRTNFSNAQLKNTDFSGAILDHAFFQHSDLSGARFDSTLLRSTDFSGASGLTQGMLQSAIGDENTILPTDALTGRQLTVPSCSIEHPWKRLIPEIEDILDDERARLGELEPLAEEVVCKPGQTPQPTGRPADP